MNGGVGVAADTPNGALTTHSAANTAIVATRRSQLMIILFAESHSLSM
jgi:hypothetical protein